MGKVNTNTHHQGVASALHGATHTMQGYPRTVETCNRYKSMYLFIYIINYNIDSVIL